MRRAILLCLVASILFACKSVQKSNEQFYELRPPEQLRSDVDYVHSKLSEYHPQLYRFITKEALDRKFDSIKVNITEPLTPNQFYLRISPAVASIRQGHATLSIPYPSTKEDKKKVAKLGYRPWFPFKAEFIDERFFILKDNRKTPEIKTGTEILSINGASPKEIYHKYLSCISRDGYNESFLPKKFPTMLYYFLREQKGTSALHYKLRLKDSVWNYSLNKEGHTPEVKVVQPKAVAAGKKKSTEKPKENKEEPVLVSSSKAKMTRFYKGDSSIAVMRIGNFARDAYKKFYRRSFRMLSDAHTKGLVLDLRDNPGGYARDAATLYSYLVDSSFQFNKKLELASRKSLLYNYRFLIKARSPLAKPFVSALATVAAVPPSLALKKQGEGKYLYPEPSSRNIKGKKNHFDGKVYVLINGGTFSAASILSADLRGSGRATFVGSETGGAQNGCVAGFLPTLTLPYSKLSLRFGLAVVEPFYAKGKEGRGIFPDIKVVPTVEDRLKGFDPELKRAIDELKK